MNNFSSVGERFDLAKSSLSQSFMRVIECLNNIANQVIAWPRDEELEKIKANFNKNLLLQGIIGAIDGIHISIKAPKIYNYIFDI